MAKHLRVDLDQVDMVSTNLHSIVQRLESAQADADQLASAIPVEELADALTRPAQAAPAVAPSGNPAPEAISRRRKGWFRGQAWFWAG